MLGWLDYGPCRDEDAPDAHEVCSVYLDPGQTRRGIGRALWNKACESIAFAGGGTVLVWVLAKNSPARRFYESMGGEVDSQAKRIATIGGRHLEKVRYRFSVTKCC